MKDATFPVPEQEAEKLDDVVETLAQQPAIQKFQDALRANPWPHIGGAALLGFLCGAVLMRR